MKKISITLLTILMLFFSVPKQSIGHPHVFIEAEMEVEMDQDGVKGIWHHWTFDEYFSAWIIDEFDINKDGVLSPEETENLYQEAFQNLKKFGFWTKVFNGKDEIAIEVLEEFSVSLHNESATYSFFLPLNIKLESDPQDIYFVVYDKDFYCQIFFPPDEINFKGEKTKWNLNYTTQKMPELTYYFGFMTPLAIKVTASES
ncbi:MAG: DUF1007 family protein [Desulfonatronovibrio sp.]